MTTTATNPRDVERLRHLNVRQFEIGANSLFNITERRDNGTALITGTPIFRTGTFRDSLGIQHTWMPEHLEQMVFHYNLLRGNLVLPNVPFRADHSSSVRNIVGYIQNLKFEGGLLLADWEVVDPEALVQIDNGKYRARSAEVGLYETNDEAFYWPVLMGCAFVDLPAVEGLYAQADRQFTALYEKENTSVTAPATPPSNTPPSTTAPAAPPAQPPATPSTPATGAPAAPPAATPEATPAAQHGQPAGVTLFVNGQATNDVVAVQQHITTLETFRSEAVKGAKEAFVKALVSGNKLPAPQLDAQIAFVHTLNDEQYDAFRKSWEGAPASPVFAAHGVTVTNPGGDAPTGPTEIEQLEDIIAMHRRTGIMTEEQIAKTPTFQKLTALRAAAK